MAVPPVDLPERDPLAPSSLNGAFSTSLKGTRAMLQKRGRRVESLVGIVEGEIRGWLGGPSWSSGEIDCSMAWKVIDGSLVDVDTAQAGPAISPTPISNRRMPPQHQIKTDLPSLPSRSMQWPAILELSRSPAHLSWAVPDSFERLVIHLIARYYELISWSASFPHALA